MKADSHRGVQKIAFVSIVKVQRVGKTPLFSCRCVGNKSQGGKEKGGRNDDFWKGGEENIV